MTLAARIQERTESMPTLPSSLARLHTLISDAKSSAADLEKVIRPDPTLSANLLKIANSPFFGLPRQCTSIRSAITLLGTRRVFEAAVGASYIRVIPARLPGYEMNSRTFCLHSVAVAQLAERLAPAAGVKVPDLLFTAGLLHDLGKLAIGSFLAEEGARLREQISARGTLVGAERELLGSDHAEVGASLCDHWQLPLPVVAAAGWHHQPDGCEGEVRLVVDLVHVANALAHMMGFGGDVGELARDLDPSVTSRLGVKVRQLEQVAGACVEQIREMGEVFASPGGTPRWA